LVAVKVFQALVVLPASSVCVTVAVSVESFNVGKSTVVVHARSVQEIAHPVTGSVAGSLSLSFTLILTSPSAVVHIHVNVIDQLLALVTVGKVVTVVVGAQRSAVNTVVPSEIFHTSSDTYTSYTIQCTMPSLAALMTVVVTSPDHAFVCFPMSAASNAASVVYVPGTVNGTTYTVPPVLLLVANTLNHAAFSAIFILSHHTDIDVSVSVGTVLSTVNVAVEADDMLPARSTTKSL
jgi:hypothetical protein